MAFLDNSGDIILDAVLTDTGRKRLAKGNGGFRVAKFALGDDEIDYELFNSSHPSGSAYYDLEIMQTPILEAFTNNTSLMKHKLLSIPQTNLLYLSVMKLNDLREPALVLTESGGDITAAAATDADSTGTGIFILPANKESEDALDATSSFKTKPGILNSANYIRVDQGQDTSDISFQEEIDSELKETQYILQMDHRMMRLTNSSRSVPMVHSYVDDDEMASYYLASDDPLVQELKNIEGRKSTSDTLGSTEVIDGPGGTFVEFNVKPQTTITTRDALFDELGSTTTVNGTANFKYIDTNIRITGATTGSSLDIPVRIMRSYTPPTP